MATDRIDTVGYKHVTFFLLILYEMMETLRCCEHGTQPERMADDDEAQTDNKCHFAEPVLKGSEELELRGEEVP